MQNKGVKNARSSLFGNASNPEKEKKQSIAADKQQLFQEQEEDAVEKDMTDYTNSLRRTVTTLKDITTSIRDELSSQNEQLSGVNSNMSDTQNTLKSTMKKLNQVVQTKTGRNTLYIVVGTLAVLLLVYYIVPYAFGGATTTTHAVEDPGL